jgi:hypothetical protein
MAAVFQEEVMRMNLSNLLKQASTAIDPEKDHGAYAWLLGEEIPRLIECVRSGEATIDEFADLFCITARREPSA